MTSARHGGAPRLIQWTGERYVPWGPDAQLAYEHLHRYLWASELVRGRRVLDLGSGEGYGAALLADTASEIVGVDIDPSSVEHSSLNYGGPGLSFERCAAEDLSRFEPGSFGAVVAFEVIEHLTEQDRVLAEVARVLSEDGLLLISTPDRRLYSVTGSEPNPFHARELSLDELSELVGRHFEHQALWGQRTIAGSWIAALNRLPEPGRTHEFFVERSGDEWRRAADPVPMYVLGVAARVPFERLPGSSLLGDAGVELVRATERRAAQAVTDRDQRLALAAEDAAALESRLRTEIDTRKAVLRDRQAQLKHLRGQLATLERRAAAAAGEHASLEQAFGELRRRDARFRGSVTVQLYQYGRGALYGAIGERSLPARAFQATLRALGRTVLPAGAATNGIAAPVLAGASGMIELPQFEDPVASLVVPLYGRPELTLACLESIVRCAGLITFEVILVDDAGDVGTRELLARVSGARVVRNRSPIGYLRSVNRGAACARGRWLVLCNNDIEVRPGWLEALVGCGESAGDVGVVAPKYVYPDGRLQEAGAIVWRDGDGWNYGRGGNANRPEFGFRREIDYGSAAALLVRRELWQARGGYDETFAPMYYEDADLCFDARRRGYRVLYEPEAVVVHHEGGSAGTDVETGWKRHQERNRPKFAAKWRAELERQPRGSGPAAVRAAAERRGGPRVLVVDMRVPMADRDSGSLRMTHMLRMLRRLGCRVTFLPDNMASIQPYTRELHRLGVHVLYGDVDVREELAAIGAEVSLAILSRPHSAARWCDVVRELCPNAMLAYDTVDLHWLREARHAALEKPSELELGPRAVALRELELAMVRATDVTLAISDAERVQIEADVPGASVRVLSNVHEARSEVPPPAGRTGVLFVGSFEHPPNEAAVIRLLREVMPRVWRDYGPVPVTVVGGSVPAAITALASARVEIAGWVEDLEPLLESARMLVAPMTWGAGVKGKVTQALAVGLPVVTTPIGAEGIGAVDGEHMLIASRDDELARRVGMLLSDDELWLGLSRRGQELIAERCAPAVISETLSELLASRPGAASVERRSLASAPPVATPATRP